jgi:microcystin degradation protein MlrC
MRIAIGGFQHEMNTFAPSKATWDDFVLGGGWPTMVAGPGIFDAVANSDIPMSGFISRREA